MQNHIQKAARWIILVKLIALMTIFSAPLHAQTVTSNPQTQNVSTSTFSGEITKIDNNKVFVSTDDGVKEITIPGNIKITRNSIESKLADLKTRDQVTVTQSTKGEVLSVDATAGNLVDGAKISLPVIIGILVLLGLLYYFWKKSQQGHIKTEVRNIH
jgi:uncharacterized membrane protein